MTDRIKNYKKMDLFIEDLNDQHVIFKFNNGNLHGFDQDVKIEIDFLELDMFNPVKQLIKEAGKEFGLQKEQIKDAKLYNEDGVKLFDSDISLISSGDVLYISLAGEDFNYGQILKRYEISPMRMNREVVLGKRISDKQRVAIRYINIQHLAMPYAKLMDSGAKSLIAIKLNHQNLIKYHFAFKHKKHVIVITEAAMGGELYDYIQKY